MSEPTLSAADRKQQLMLEYRGQIRTLTAENTELKNRVDLLNEQLGAASGNEDDLPGTEAPHAPSKNTNDTDGVIKPQAGQDAIDAGWEAIIADRDYGPDSVTPSSAA